MRHLPLGSRGSCIWLCTELRQSCSEPSTLLIWLWMRSKKRTRFPVSRKLALRALGGLSPASLQRIPALA